MAENETLPEETQPTKPKSKLMFKLGIAGFVLAVVSVECLVAYLFLPKLGAPHAAAAAADAASASEAEHKALQAEKEAGKEKAHGKPAEKEGGKHGEKGGKHEKGEKKGGHGAPVAEVVEADLGEFSVTGTQLSSGSTLRIALHLYGTVSGLDAERFETKMAEIQHRFREQVIVTLRGAQAADLSDAGLGLLKRAILEKTNALLGEPLLKTVVFSEFSFFEM